MANDRHGTDQAGPIVFVAVYAVLIALCLGLWFGLGYLIAAVLR